MGRLVPGSRFRGRRFWGGFGCEANGNAPISIQIARAGGPGILGSDHAPETLVAKSLVRLSVTAFYTDSLDYDHSPSMQHMHEDSSIKLESRLLATALGSDFVATLS